MNEFNLIGVLKSVMPLEETASGIKVINFIVEVDRPFKSDKKDLFQTFISLILDDEKEHKVLDCIKLIDKIPLK